MTADCCGLVLLLLAPLWLTTPLALSPACLVFVCVRANAAGVLKCSSALVIANNGTLRLFNVSASQPAGCTVPVIEPGVTVQCSVTKAVAQGDFEAGQLSLSVGVAATSGPGSGSQPVKSSAQATVQLVQTPSMSVAIAVAPGEPTMVNAAGETAGCWACVLFFLANVLHAVSCSVRLAHCTCRVLLQAPRSSLW